MGFLQSRTDDFLVYKQEFASLVLEELQRQGAVPVAGRLQQDVVQTGAGPDD